MDNTTLLVAMYVLMLTGTVSCNSSKGLHSSAVEFLAEEVCRQQPQVSQRRHQIQGAAAVYVNSLLFWFCRLLRAIMFIIIWKKLQGCCIQQQFIFIYLLIM